MQGAVRTVQFLPQRSDLVLSDLDSPNKLASDTSSQVFRSARLPNYRAALNYKAVVLYSEKLIEA